MTTTTAAGVDRRTAARRGCTRWLLGHGDITPAAWLQELVAAASEPDLDRYGAGGEVEALEREVAELLGKEAAVFMPSGVMAQQAVMRSWVERSTTDAVAVHGLSHLVLHELDALSELHHLRVQHLTHDPRPASAADLDALPRPLAAVSIELPVRDAGFVLPTWDELVAFTDRSHERGVPVHFDGARLWESQPFYDRSLAEIVRHPNGVLVHQQGGSRRRCRCGAGGMRRSEHLALRRRRRVRANKGDQYPTQKPRTLPMPRRQVAHRLGRPVAQPLHWRPWHWRRLALHSAW